MTEEWQSDTIENICSKITDGEHIRPKTTDVGIPFLSAKDVREEGVNFDSSLFVSGSDALKFRKRCNPEKEIF